MAFRIQALVGLRISRNRVPGVCHPQAATYITLVRPPQTIMTFFLDLSGPIAVILHDRPAYHVRLYLGSLCTHSLQISNSPSTRPVQQPTRHKVSGQPRLLQVYSLFSPKRHS